MRRWRPRQRHDRRTPVVGKGQSLALQPEALAQSTILGFPITAPYRIRSPACHSGGHWTPQNCRDMVSPWQATGWRHPRTSRDLDGLQNTPCGQPHIYYDILIITIRVLIEDRRSACCRDFRLAPSRAASSRSEISPPLPPLGSHELSPRSKSLEKLLSHLSRYLKERHPAQLRLSLKEIESIVGTPLPAAARSARWWAASETGASRPQRAAWVVAGYDAALSDFAAVVSFRPAVAVTPTVAPQDLMASVFPSDGHEPARRLRPGRHSVPFQSPPRRRGDR